MRLIQVPVVIVPFNICRDSKIRCTLQDLRNQDTNWATFWFDLARFDGLTRIHEFVRLSSGLATWHPLLCPQAWGKGFYVVFYHGLVSWFFMVGIFGTWRRWPIGTEMQTSCQTSQMKVSSCLWILLGLYHLHSWRDWGDIENRVEDIQRHPMWDIIYSMNQMNQMNQKTTTLNYSITQRQSHRENVVWHLDRSTEVATHWELLVLLEGSGRLKMDENYDKSKKQNQSVDSKVSVYIMKIMNQ